MTSPPHRANVCPADPHPALLVSQDFLDAATSHAATPPPQPKPIVPALGPMTLSLAPTDTERSTKMTLLSTNRFFAL
eukprot:4951133-Prymnesium_polylepis.1